MILTADGYILTNKHVVAGSQSLTVELADGDQFPATIVKESDDKDLALIKIDATGLTPAVIGDSARSRSARRSSPSAARSARSPRR